MLRGLKSITVSLAALALIISGCGGSGGGSTENKPEIKFFNSVSDAVAADFYLDGDALALNVPYKTASPSFVKRNAGEYDGFLYETGTLSDLYAESVSLQTNVDRVIVGIGLKNYGLEALKRARFVQYTVNRKVPVGNKSRIYVVNGLVTAAGVSLLQVDFRQPGNSVLIDLRNIAFGDQRETLVDSGNQTFQVRQSSTEGTPFVTETFNFLPGKVYLVTINGVLDSSGASAPDLVFTDIETTTE